MGICRAECATTDFKFWHFIRLRLRLRRDRNCTFGKFPAATPQQALSPACGAVDGSHGCSHAVAEPGVESKNHGESGQHRDCDAVEDGRLNGDGR